MHNNAIVGHSPTPWLAAATRGLSLLLLSGLVGLVGCGPSGAPAPKNSVSGKVTMEGKPVSGTVTLIGADKTAEGLLTDIGTYMIPDPPTGEVKITVKGMGLPGGSKPDMPGAAPGPTLKAGVEPPAKYASPDSSGLTFKIESGKQVHDIVLTP